MVAEKSNWISAVRGTGRRQTSRRQPSEIVIKFFQKKQKGTSRYLEVLYLTSYLEVAINSTELPRSGDNVSSHTFEKDERNFRRPASRRTLAMCEKDKCTTFRAAFIPTSAVPRTRKESAAAGRESPRASARWRSSMMGGPCQ